MDLLPGSVAGLRAYQENRQVEDLHCQQKLKSRGSQGRFELEGGRIASFNFWRR
jgi:hypothetical protein